MVPGQPIIFEIGHGEAAKCEIARESLCSRELGWAILQVKRVAARKRGENRREEDTEKEREGEKERFSIVFSARENIFLVEISLNYNTAIITMPE